MHTSRMSERGKHLGMSRSREGAACQRMEEDGVDRIGFGGLACSWIERLETIEEGGEMQVKAPSVGEEGREFSQWKRELNNPGCGYDNVWRRLMKRGKQTDELGCWRQREAEAAVGGSRLA